jgi:2-polyprenyl-3-methyl-5-hydroxy-6-metoxy-1,4-benzoquinol methylase
MDNTKSATCIWCNNITSQLGLYSTYDLEGQSYDLLECSECGTVNLYPLPSTEYLEKYYAEDYYGASDEKFQQGLIENILDSFRKRKATKIARSIGSTGNVLDIGCGNGKFLAHLSSLGEIKTYGVEMPGNAAKRASQISSIDLKIGSLQKSDFPENYFDAVTLIHVFEHLLNPKEIIQIIHKILKPHGYLYMAFPNIGSFQSKIFEGDWLHLDPPRHTFFMRPYEFESIMEDEGFTLERRSFFNVEYNPFGFQQSLLNKLFAKREVLYESLKGNSNYTKDYQGFNLFLQQNFFRLSFPLFILLDRLTSSFNKGATVEYLLRSTKDS